MAFLKRIVSKKKKRFQEDGFDLDLTYVTPRIIAMGFPSIKLEGVYRNNMTDVQQFFETRHKGRYKVYNLCSERAYESTYFGGRVERFPFDDHNAPPFEIMTPFCRSADEWLSAHQDNVIVVHCKAGKGRTGVMICAYLVYSGACKTAQESLDFYAKSRTYDNEGVTIPSQRRFVKYYGDFVNGGARVPFPNQRIILDEIVFHGVPKNASHFAYKIKDAYGKELLSARESPRPMASRLIFTACKGLELTDDFKVIFSEDNEQNFVVPVKKKEKDLFHFWLNCNFMAKPSCVITKDTIDRANKDKKHRSYPKDFRIEIFFTVIDPLSRKNSESTDVARRSRIKSIGDDEYGDVETDQSSRDSDEFTDPDVLLEEDLIRQIEEEYNYLLTQSKYGRIGTR